MSLKDLCMKNMVEIIKNLPPMMIEEVIGKSLEAIEKDIKEKVMKEIRCSAVIVTEDVTERIIEASKTGQSWQRPEYTNDIDDELYYTCVDIAQRFVDNNSDKLVFTNNPQDVNNSYVYRYDSDQDEESEIDY